MVAMMLVCMIAPVTARASTTGAAMYAWQWLNAPSPSAHADEATPSEAILQQLRDRLLGKDPCLDACAALARLDLQLDNNIVRLTLEAHAMSDAVIPLPGNAQHWLPSEILVDGSNARRLTRNEQGFLILALSPGVHQIILRGRVPARDSVQIDLPLRPRWAQATAPGWTARSS